MKNLFTLLFLAIICHFSQAQTSNIPDLVNFQGIARDVNGNLVVSQTIQVQITILEGASLPGATALYRELHQPITDVFGAFQIVLNENTSFVNPIVFTFANIPWNTGNKWARIEYQTSLGGTLIELATIKLTSSFYAFASRTAERADSLAGVDINNPSNGQVISYDASAGKWKPSSNSPRIAVLKENKPLGQSPSGPFIQDVWIKRELNTVEETGASFVSLNASSHQFMLAPGKYLIEASAAGYYVSSHVLRLVSFDNAGNETSVVLGRPGYALNMVGGEQTDVVLVGIFTVSSTLNFEIQHRITATYSGSPSGSGFGVPYTFGLSSGQMPWTIAKITKLE